MNVLQAGQVRVIAEQAKTDVIRGYPMFPPSLYYRFLRLMVNAMQPEMCVELGVCGGGGSYYMASADWQCKVIGVDRTNDYPVNIDFIRANCPLYTFEVADSVAYAQQMDEDVDLLFIDTVHTYNHTMDEFNAWRNELSFGAIVVLDDLFREGMQQVWEELPGEKVRLDFLHVGGSPTDGGFGVILL